jgi:hypothetical protein
VLGYTPPQPQFWKALIAVAPIVAVVAWSLHFIHIVMPLPVLIGVSAAAWVVIAGAVHSRVSNDWRSQWNIEVNAAEYRTRPKNR